MLNLRQKERKGNNKNNRAGKEGSRTVISYIDRLNNRVSRPHYLKLKIRDPLQCCRLPQPGTLVI